MDRNETLESKKLWKYSIVLNLCKALTEVSTECMEGFVAEKKILSFKKFRFYTQIISLIYSNKIKK